MSLDFLKKQVFSVDGVTLTIGSLVILVVVVYLIVKWRKG